MPQLKSDEKTTLVLSAGQWLKLTVPSGASCVVLRLGDKAGDLDGCARTVGTPGQVEEAYIGPYPYPTRFRITCSAGPITYEATLPRLMSDRGEHLESAEWRPENWRDDGTHV